MHFPYSITVIITRPFVLAMTNRGMGPNHMIVAAPLIGIDPGDAGGKAMNMVDRGC